MVSIRRYHWIVHEHEHYCPSCQLQLEPIESDSSTTAVEELECVTQSCPVVHCYCNGTLDAYSLSEREAFRCANEILFTLDRSFEALPFNSINSITDLGVKLRTEINEYKPRLEPKDAIRVEELFEVFAEMERTLLGKDYTTEKQSINTGKRVLDFNGVYVPYDAVLVYTVITNEFDEPRIIRYPTENAQYLDAEAVEPYEPSFNAALNEYRADLMES